MAPEKTRASFLLCLLVMCGPAFAQVKTKVKPKTKPVPNQTKGQGQVAGAYVKFGEIYTLKNGINFEILKGAYTMNTFPCYGGKQNSKAEKLVVLDIAVKNWRPSDLDFGGASGLVTLVDSAGTKYDGEAQLKSRGVKETYLTLKPGQGVGQPTLNDPYRIAYQIPADVEITKIIVNQPRLNKNEEVLRYVLAGTDKEADPANVIAPLPPEVRDPANKSGAVALKEGAGTLNAVLPAGGFTYQVTKIEPTVASLSEKYTPREGHRYVIVTLKMTNVDLRDLSSYDANPRDSYITDGDGEKTTLDSIIKASSPEESPSSTMSPGESKTVRLVFEVSSTATLQNLFLTGSYYPWKFDLTK